MRKRGKRYQKKAIMTTTFPGWGPPPSSVPPDEDALLRMWNLCTDGDIGKITLLFPSKKELNKTLRHYQKKAAK